MSSIQLKSCNQNILHCWLNAPHFKILKESLLDTLEQSDDFLTGSALVLVCPENITVEVLAQFLELCYQQSLKPIGIETSSEALAQYADISGLAIFNPDTVEAVDVVTVVPETTPEQTVEETADAVDTQNTTRIIHGSIRSGQQVYAAHGDLVIYGNVNSGAEVAADGDVHIYGKLSGRAMAGAQGNETARMTVKMLDAELISIAGTYSQELGKDISKTLWNQIYLHQNQLIIEPL